MSQRFPGGFLTQSPPTPSASNTTGVWTLDQQEQLKQSGQWPPNGPFFIEDLFSTWLYTGNGSTQTITNGIDLAGKGGLVWIKQRNFNQIHVLVDTVRGNNKRLQSNSTAAEDTTSSLMSFNANGFSVPNNYGITNQGDQIYASWTFREQPKFFDVVTFTANSSSNASFSHSLGSVPGCILFKQYNGSPDNWFVYHRSLGGNKFLKLNLTDAEANYGATWLSATSTTIDVQNGFLNANQLYVAYLFAHNAGGFGLSGTDNVISCGSFTTDGSGNATVNLGYEPQWVLIKNTTRGSTNWYINDNMRGMPASGQSRGLKPNTADSETGDNLPNPNATGFTVTSVADFGGADTYIYIAIRRGPMKVPTTGTSVYMPLATPATTEGNVGFPADLAIAKYPIGSQFWLWGDRLRNAILYSDQTSAENAHFGGAGPRPFDTQNGVKLTGITATDYDFWMMRRAPGFFDEVCYTGNSVQNRQVAHNLTVTPELLIVKKRNAAKQGYVYNATTGATGFLRLFTASGGDSAFQTSDIPWNNVEPTATYISLNSDDAVNGSGDTYVAYLFASCPGVSKVGSYTGTGTTQTINCGFTAGARFVLIKRTDSTGDWYVWDTARGMIPANDPYLLLNSTAAEVTGTDFVDTAATGFEITSTAPAAINASGGKFIFLAIA